MTSLCKSRLIEYAIVQVIGEKNSGKSMIYHDIQHLREVKRLLPIALCEERAYDLLLVPFQSFWNHDFFIKLNLPLLLVLVRQQEKSQKYFDPSAFNWNLNHSHL